MASESSVNLVPNNVGPRQLKERELVNLFMACGILEHIAKDIIRSSQELKHINDKNSEDFKQLVREVTKYSK